MSKAIGIDLGTTNSLVAYVKDGVPFVIPDATGDALCRRSCPSPRRARSTSAATRRAGCSPTPARTVYSVKRFMGKGIDDLARRGAAVSVPHRRRAGRRRADRSRRTAAHAAGDLRVHSARAEAPRRDLLPRAGRFRSRGISRRHHRARLFQRRAAHGDARRRTTRRARRAAHHQRADRGVAGLRARQAPPRHDRGLRPRRRHLRHLDPEGRGRRVPGARHQRRHAPGRRRHRSRC